MGVQGYHQIINVVFEASGVDLLKNILFISLVIAGH